MSSCSDSRTPDGPRLGLYSGLVLAGIGMGMVVGQGVAVASPNDSTSASTSANADSSASADTSDTASSTTERSSAKPADEDDAEDDDQDAVDEAVEADAVETDEATEVAEAELAEAESDGDEARQSRKPRSKADDDEATARTDSADTGADTSSPAVDVDTEKVSFAAAVSAPATSTPAAATPDPQPTVRDLVSARPVTAEAIVTDILTWAGVRPLSGDAPTPATPVSTLLQGLWIAVRQHQYTWNNQRPVASVEIAGADPNGVITGNLNAVDYDDTTLTYVVSSAPAYGRVRVDAEGRFTYTPGAAAAGRADTFTIRIDDTVGNPFHVHGLAGLLGITGPTEVTITIPAASDGAHAAPTVVVSTGSGSSGGKVIDGHITDEIVVNAEDAAAVLNALASALGASEGFADRAVVTTTTAGSGATAEHFYRFSETVGGIPVLGSEVILVTNADGEVTSVFNYHRGLGQDFDITPDASIDEDTEIRLVAGQAYLGSADQQAIENFIAASTFTNSLVIYTVAEDDAPALAWRVVVHVPDTGELAPSGKTFLIYADGERAGEVIIAVSNAQAAAVTATARDWLGNNRSITVETRRVWFFTTTEMADSNRMIATYKTKYGFFGIGAPTLPGTIVKRSLFGWDKAAVSAHANTALAYDYFLNVLGRQSYDNAGAPIIISIKYRPDTSPLGYANAFWDPTINQMAFGDKGYFQAALDIVAHEYAHAVINYIVGKGEVALDSGEPGALNEAYADIFGLLIENKTGHERWLIAEDSDNGVIRDLSNPKSIMTPYGPHRDRYSERYMGQADDGGEHVNSTIFGHAAYLMMTDPATADVSDDTWARVFYHSLERLTSTSMFVDGRAAVLDAALAQGLTFAQRQAIANAFDTVEIKGTAPSQVIAV